MSEKPFPENLISGYLDGQLTEEERALVEQRMQEDPATKRLVEELRANAEQMQGLPRFRAPEGFAERLMASPELDRAFSELATDEVGPQAKLSGETSSFKRTKRFRLAVAAIVSLAAMVLVVFFLPQSYESASLQVKKNSESAGEIKSPVQPKGKIALEKDAVDSMKMEVLPEAAASLEDKSDLSKSKRVQSAERSPNRMQEVDPSSRRRFAANDDAGFDDRMPVAPATNEILEPERERNPAVVGDSQQLSIELKKSLVARKISEVVEIEFTQGPEALGMIQESLQRNQILLTEADAELANDEEADESQNEPLRGIASEENGERLFWRRELNKAVAGRGGMPNSSQAFVVTATPSQMVRLFSDMSQRASIKLYPVDAVDSSKNGLAVPQVELQKTKQIEIPARDNAKTGEGNVASELAKQLARKKQPSSMSGASIVGDRQAIGEPSADLPAKEQAKALGQPKEDLYSYYFENTDKDQPRRFLLFVRSNVAVVPRLESSSEADVLPADSAPDK